MKVFIISAMQDRMLHDDISASLQRERIAVWFDAAMSFRTLEEDLRAWMSDADLIVVLWSQDAADSSYVELELKVAIELEKKFILLRIEDAPLPDLPSYCAILSAESKERVGSIVVDFIKRRCARHLFLSYSSQDDEFADDVLRLIAKSDHQVWVDRSSIEAGEQFPEKILKAIEAADDVLLLWSSNARSSRWVEHEWNHAYKLSKTIVPILLDDTPLPMSLEDTSGIRSLKDEFLARFLGIH